MMKALCLAAYVLNNVVVMPLVWAVGLCLAVVLAAQVCPCIRDMDLWTSTLVPGTAYLIRGCLGVGFVAAKWTE